MWGLVEGGGGGGIPDSYNASTHVIVQGDVEIVHTSFYSHSRCSIYLCGEYKLDQVTLIFLIIFSNLRRMCVFM